MADKNIEQYWSETVQRLPEEVRNFVFENCTPTKREKESIEGTQGLTVETKGKNYLILFFMPFDSALDPHSICAHEIAHAWLLHKELNTPVEEITVEEQVRKWGFCGLPPQVEGYDNGTWYLND